jgi:putative CocE/NonD family hydrolase
MHATVRFGYAALLISLSSLAIAQGSGWRDNWEATEVMIPMRDGTKLFTVFHTPKNKPGPFPILMSRTPYGAGSAAGAPRTPNPKIVESGYIIASQDVRGKGKSEGEFVNIKPTLPKGAQGVDESTDTYDTVEYLINNVPKNSKRVGLWGISYPGFYAGAGAIRNHPARVAVSPQAPVNDWFRGDDVAHRGVMFVQETFDFCVNFDVPRGGERITIDREGLSAYDFYLKAGALSNFESKFLKGKLPYWQELMENDIENEYWKSRALWRSFNDVNCAVLTVGGFFDKEDMYGALKLYSAGEKQNPGKPNYICMGPWSHGGWASRGGTSLSDLSFGSATSAWYQENVEFPFFEKHLKGVPGSKDIAEANIFETGTNTWHQFDSWPPKGLKPMSVYLDANKGLNFNKPVLKSEASYVYDPAKPTPYVPDWQTSRRASGDWLAKDQAFLETRMDQATYRMEALGEDIRVAGPIKADLWITTTGTDCDLVVQVIDEYPADTTDKKPNGDSMAGYQMMVRGEIMRAKFRNSFEKPEPIKPNTPTRVSFELNDVLHTFPKGHRIVIRVMSSWFPIAERGSNVFLSRTMTKDSDFKPAKITLLHGANQASRIEVGKFEKG